jgi:hypothetical protein
MPKKRRETNIDFPEKIKYVAPNILIKIDAHKTRLKIKKQILQGI